MAKSWGASSTNGKENRSNPVLVGGKQARNPNKDEASFCFFISQQCLMFKTLSYLKMSALIVITIAASRDSLAKPRSSKKPPSPVDKNLATFSSGLRDSSGSIILTIKKYAGVLVRILAEIELARH